MLAHRIETEHAQLTLIWMPQPAHQTDRRRRARAAGADETKHLAAPHLETEPGERGRLTVSLHDAIQPDGCVVIRVASHCSVSSASTGIPDFRTPLRLSTLTLI